MGNFRIEIEAVGPHGEPFERRKIGDGEELDFESLPESSVDRVAHEAVEALKARGATINSAKLIHWPGQSSEVVDDVLAKQRHGSF
jgi:Asp-tRNA(Asn)/Glu-tRNA(Gln) amidotransferase A subunit family amidase